MADSTRGSTRPQRRLRPGGGSRNTSARSSAVYGDDFLQLPGYGSHALRSSSSRFSLNDQFATTRREFEFGFDDAASSILDRSTLSSESGNGPEDTVVIGPIGTDEPDEPLSALLAACRERDFYHLLCLPRNPSVYAIRRAYYRLFFLLYPDTYPCKLRGFAEVYFAAVQTAFETLLDPCRKSKYDQDKLEEVVNPALDRNVEVDYHDYLRCHTEFLKHHLLNLGQDEASGLDLETGFDAERLSKLDSQRPGSFLKAVDFSMGQSLSIPLPKLGTSINQTIFQARNFLGRVTRGKLAIHAAGYDEFPRATYEGTTLSARASIYGILQDVMTIPTSALADPRQPISSTDFPYKRALQLLDGPLLTLKLQHQLQHYDSQSGTHLFPDRPLLGAIVEVETDVIPIPSLAGRISKTIVLPRDTKPSFMQFASRISPWHTNTPRVALSLQRTTASGMLLFSADSGAWSGRSEKTCHAFTLFPQINRRLLNLYFPLVVAPKIEMAYKMGSSFRFRDTSCISVRAAERSGLRGLDWDMDHDGPGSWTVSTTAEPDCVGSSLKYAIDVNMELKMLFVGAEAGSPNLPSQPSGVAGRGVRVEAELCSNSPWAGFLALRCLKRVGHSSKLGFEVSLSTYSLHLSLYWSRLGQRISLPFLVTSRAEISTKVLFWTTVLPFAGLAAWEFAGYRRRRKSATKRQQKQDWRATFKQRRAEADEVTILLGAHVEKRQKSERAKGGLVILSAKYGVKVPNETNAWGSEEVADVTIAVAALVDSGMLYIPGGIQKSHLLGFWDPFPSSEKVLHVRYSWQGKEDAVEVRGDEQLILPPRL